MFGQCPGHKWQAVSALFCKSAGRGDLGWAGRVPGHIHLCVLSGGCRGSEATGAPGGWQAEGRECVDGRTPQTHAGAFSIFHGSALSLTSSAIGANYLNFSP